MTHLAGPQVLFNNRSIQRCVVCGERLHDSTPCPDWWVTDHPWERGVLVRIQGDTIKAIGKPMPNAMPKDLCIHTMVEY